MVSEEQTVVGKDLSERAEGIDYPLVSVITLSYNSPDLFAAVDSVISQSYPKIEYILVDDASKEFSKDRVMTHINSFAKTNIKDVKIIVNEWNKGITASANTALREASGEYVFYVAGDDAFRDENVLSDWVNAFLHKKAQIMTAYRDVYDSQMDKYIGREPSEEKVEMIKHLGSKELFEKMVGSNFVFGCCTAFSRKILEKYGPYNEEYRFVDDYPMILKLLRCGEKIDFFDRTVVKYRRGGISSFENVNSIYLTESDKIFAKEILPYVSNAKIAKKEYTRWKRQLKRDRDQFLYLRKKEVYRHNPIKLAALYISHGICHPERIIVKIKSKLEK